MNDNRDNAPIANEIRATSIYQLARIADVADPDGLDTAGARFLRSVADDFADALEDKDADEITLDEILEMADGHVPVYTHQIWTTFVDLAAYNEDLRGFVTEDEDMERRAMVALCMIAERLMENLCDQHEIDL